jgi:hypothetical protein
LTGSESAPYGALDLAPEWARTDKH